MTLHERLTAPGPKRILSLDGGGIRGVVTLGFLERIERLLREHHGQPDLRLSDYFDLIGGTSTGAIIAGALALGMEVAEIRTKYLALGGIVFGKRMRRRWRALFDAKPLSEELRNVFGEVALGDAAVKTGLSITVKRADNGQTWLLQNHPEGKYYCRVKDIPLWSAVRASTAAPIYFMPELIALGHEEVGAFVDGGVSMANNPAFHLFLLATLKGLPYCWPLGEQKLLLVSVGTGSWRRRETPAGVMAHTLWDWAQELPFMLIDDASWHNQLILQGLSHTPTPWEINGEVGDLVHDLFGLAPSLSYLRYDVWLEPESLEALGLTELIPYLSSLQTLSAAERRFDLAHIGERAAEESVLASHFPDAFMRRAPHLVG